MNLKNKYSPFLAIAVLGLAVLSGCSSEIVGIGQVDQDTLYQRYEASYSEELDQTELFAQFRVGGPTGTTVEVNDPAQILVDDAPMQAAELVGREYQLKQSNPRTMKHQFVFVDFDGNKYVNTAEIVGFEVVEAPKRGRTHQDIVIKIDGPPLRTGESYAISDLSKYADGSFSIAITGSKLKEQKNGLWSFKLVDSETSKLLEAEITISRVMSHPAQAGEEGGEVVTQFKAAPFTMIIE